MITCCNHSMIMYSITAVISDKLINVLISEIRLRSDILKEAA